MIVATPILVLLVLWRIGTVTLSPSLGHSVYPLKALAISAGFAVLVRSLRAATIPAALCGALICLIVTLAGSSPAHSGLPALILLFVLTFAATRLGRARKESRGLAEPRTGRRASQVIANLGAAGLCAALSGKHPAFAIAMLAALAEATADTVSSETGQAFGGTPRMLLTRRPVPPGTDGAVTLTGTLAGITVAALVAASAIPALGLTLPQVALALLAGIAGLFFDSLLGATLERKGWIGNDLVNLTSTLFAALSALTLARTS
ncbi:MAG: hypothetical protein NVSMB62_13060 [Acidobacteriaceae bacterium]